MKKLIFLFALLALTTACWDDDDDDWWDPHKHTLTVTVSDDCNHPPFRIYIDGRDAHDKVGEIESPGGTVLIIMDSGRHDIYIRDDDGEWIYEDNFQLDEDETIWVDCSGGKKFGVRSWEFGGEKP